MPMDPKKLRAVGDWIEQLRHLLNLPSGEQRKLGPRPDAQKRETKEAVKTLLSSLREGVGSARPDTQQVDDLDKVIFNAVDTLIADRVRADKKNRFDAIAKFRAVLLDRFDDEPKNSSPLDAAWKAKIAEALNALWQEASQREGSILVEKDLSELKKIDFKKAYGTGRHDVIGQAMLASASRYPSANKNNVDRGNEMDPETFGHLAKLAKKENLDNADMGLGAKIVQQLWSRGHYDEMCLLIEKGLDTTRSAPLPEGHSGVGRGIHSGHYQAVQHLVYKHLRDVEMLDQGTKMPPDTEGIAQGVKKIVACLERNGLAQSLTSWQAVKSSGLVTEFQEKPGTIWGFEHLREPFVQAAHETDHGARPVRMLELWDAVSLSFMTPQAYDELLANPDTASDNFVEKGASILQDRLDKKDAKLADLQKDPAAFMKKFKIDAKAMLMEFAEQIPKASFGRQALGNDLQPQQGETDKVSNLAGIMSGKMEGGMACKAGLWWAKQAKEPVYYCLDGIDMKQVVDYKKVKNKAVEEFISAGGKPAGATGHSEVITFTELREVLKHWDELKDTVKFVIKGEIQTGDKLARGVKDWQDQMESSNKQAGRTPAPPRAHFANELAAINPALMNQLSQGAKGDMDARDLVKKFGYLVRVSNARPEILLRYLISRCAVLVEYGLLNHYLLCTAAELGKAKDAKDANRLAIELKIHIKSCHEAFHTPLVNCLLRHPLLRPQQMEGFDI